MEWGLLRVYKAFTGRQLATEETKTRGLETVLGADGLPPVASPLSLPNTGRRGARYKGTYILADAYPQLTRRVSDRCLRAQFHIFATDTELQSTLAAEAEAEAAATAAVA